MVWKSITAAGAAFLFGSLTALYAAGPPIGSGVVSTMPIASSPVALDASDPSVDRIGRLASLGTHVLTSSNRQFGGISAMLWFEGCNRLLAASDTGVWVILEPNETDGRLVGVRDAWIAPILGLDGRPPGSKSEADAESLSRAANGDIWVFYEQRHRGMRFEGIDACRPETLATAPVAEWVLGDTGTWPGNGGIESSAMQGETLLMITEDVPGSKTGRLGLAGGPSGVQRFSYANPEGHQPTAMDPLDPGHDNGRMLLLHRSWSPLRGASAIFAEAQIDADPAELVEPKVIARFRPPVLVDNMEALAVRAEGERRFVYLMSDDNFNPLQRTVLMKFELLPEEKQPEGG